MKAFFILARVLPVKCVLLLGLVLTVLTACTGRSAAPIASPGTLPTLAPFATITPPSPATSSSTPEPPPTATSIPLPTATITPAPLIDLPAPLYVLAAEDYFQGGTLWVLRPGEQAAEQVQTANESVTCFDLSPVDGSLAYGTASGRVFVMAMGEAPNMVVDTSIDARYPTEITGINWSPDGTRLAYTIGFHEDGELIRELENQYWPTGVWIVEPLKSAPVWLVSNSYESPEGIEKISMLHDPIWSPDGKSLAVNEGKWEHIQTAWFYPVRLVAANEELHRAYYTNFSWSTDSEGLVLGGIPYDDSVDLAFVPREGGVERQLVDGEKEQLDTEQVFVLNTGIAFIGYIVGEYDSPVMFIGKLEGSAFQWQEMTPNPLCWDHKNYPVFAHHTGEDIITQMCGKTDLRQIDPAANTYKEIDLTPFLQKVKGAVIQIHWGAD